MKKTGSKSPRSVKRAVQEDVRTALTPSALKRAIMDNLYLIQGRVPMTATRNDWYMALAYTVRDRILHRWMQTIESYMGTKVKSVSYLSAEFLIGPQLGSHLISLGIYDEVKQAVSELGHDLDDLLEQEEEPGLGNGGLGRLAACFLDSLAALEILGVGYGIRYEFGIFDQEIRDGWQVEVTDKWLRFGHPWEVPRPEITFNVNFGGHTEHTADAEGRHKVLWVPDRAVRGVACDIPVPGYKVNTVNLLRLWKAEATESFDFQAFNVGDYYGAVESKVSSENITKVLYPNDEAIRGKLLRLEQQYFFVSCSLQDLIRVHLRRGDDMKDFHKSNAIQLNDTHPSIAVAEMMRLLVDEHRLEWDVAWHITQNTFGYTNHTLLPEALEKWPLPLFGSLLPRHLEIIFEINRRFLEEIRAKGCNDESRIARLSLIEESGSKFVRMANLASVGSHAINGVAALHTELLKRDVLFDFHELFPEKFLNVTNGVTPRRWVVLANPHLARLITSKIGDRWIQNMESHLQKLEKYAGNGEFQNEWRQIKYENKAKLAAVIRERTGVVVDPSSLFDIQVKRIHEYKRQHLNVLHVLSLYNRIKVDPGIDFVPRTVIFAGKAAPGYRMAKLIIKLINSVAEVVNNDPDVAGRLKVVFLPDFNVKNAHAVYPAADLSQQISTAGKEASGTGNMKFSMNGALTIGTLDGANVEIREAVGAENFFLFGLAADEVSTLRTEGYDPFRCMETNGELREVINLILSGALSRGDPGLFKPLVDSFLYFDPYMLMADYAPYIECQNRVDVAYRDQAQWTRMSILNVARVGRFSSDRSIREYAAKIWNVKPVKIKIG
ncbi:MAG TPA: glycogen phosphorylase [Bacteroidetes bacterium]|nr:MAG: glycogen phosphorylase [Ignavibacteria bacterium GWA2_54_16]HCA81156.1 glycogen phosphorylase [Bacteroidota bacterium]